jgi:hypothetical protein
MIVGLTTETEVTTTSPAKALLRSVAGSSGSTLDDFNDFLIVDYALGGVRLLEISEEQRELGEALWSAIARS